MIFSTSDEQYEELVRFSKDCDYAIIFCLFQQYRRDSGGIYTTYKKYRYIIDKVLIDKSDRVALKELSQLMDYERTLLKQGTSR